jgi:amino acid permease
MMSPGGVGHRKTVFGRAFGKLSKGSLRGSIFSLCASAIGSGVLSLPSVLAATGWAIGLGLVTLGAIAACWSLFIIAESAIKTKAKNFSQLAQKSGGIKLERIL